MKCIAKVNVTIQISLTQPWDPKASLEELYRQSKEDAMKKIKQLLAATDDEILIIGDPKSIAILSREE